MRRAAIIAAVVLAFIAIIVPFVVHGLDRDGAPASAATRAIDPSAGVAPTHQHSVADAGLGPHGSLPALLPLRSPVTDGAQVRVGNVTSGVLRKQPDGSWQVMVRWNGRIQQVPTRGPVSLGTSSAQGTTSWVSRDGALYTRVPVAAGQFHVYAWHPGDATAYTPPPLVARDLGLVCFNKSFTAFGNCQTAG